MAASKSSKKTSKIFDKKQLSHLLTANSPFAMKESYSTVRTNLSFVSQNDRCPTYAITSSLPNDGKTVNTINIAISFAQMGKRVLLLDCDLRNSTMHKYFGFAPENGVSEYLAGIEQTLNIRTTNVDNLDVVTSGKYPPNPAELMAGPRTELLLAEARKIYDLIFIDTPPVEMVADATVLSSLITGFIFVVKNGSSDLDTIKHSVLSMQQVKANIVGFVLNNVDNKNRRYYKNYSYYNYKYGYSRYGYKYGYKYGYGYGQDQSANK